LDFLHIFLGIFSAGLSTISAALNSLAAVTLEDYIKPVYRQCSGHEISSTKSVFIAKVLAFTFGIICIALAFLAQLFGGLLQVILIMLLFLNIFLSWFKIDNDKINFSYCRLP